MGKKEWPNELIAKLIDMYKTRPSLWKFNHADYMNKKVKNRDYEEITTEMQKTIPNLDVTLVKGKIQNLRTCFRKEQRKVDVSEQSGAGIYEPSLWYYERLSFVNEQEGPLPSVNYGHPGNSERSPLGSGSQSQMSQMSYENDDSDAEEPDEESWNEPHSQVEIQYPCFKEPQPPASKRSRILAEPAMSTLLKTLTTALTSQPDDDECVIAGKYIAQKLKQMSPQQQILAESIIQQVLSKGLRNRLTDTTALVD